jgi:hypothetical protein
MSDSYFKKIIIFSLIFLIIFNSTAGFLKTQKVAAGIPVTCTNCAAEWTQITQLASDTGGFVERAARWLKEDSVKALRDMIAKRILDYIVNETVKWIQGGGEPKFVGNWEGFLKDVGDIAFDSVIKDVGLARLCSPFALQVRISLLPELNFRQRIDCTLDQVVSNIQNFYVDFSVGGWQAYNELWKPNNNFYGFALIAHDEALRRIITKKEAAKNEAIAGAGFMGDKICKAGSNLSSDIEIAVEQDCVEFTGYPAGSDEYNLCAESRRNYYIKTSDLAKDKNNEVCDPKNLVDANPGSIVGKAVGEAITTDGKWAANIQSWVAALVNAIINRVVKEGIREMKSITSKDYGSKATGYYPEEYYNAASQEFQQANEKMKSEVLKFRGEWQYRRDAKKRALVFANELLPVLTEIESKNCPKSAEVPLTGMVSISSTASSTQDTINRLQTEIADLEAKIQEADSLLEIIDKAPTDAAKADTAGKRAEVERVYTTYMNKYNTSDFQRQIIDGSARQAVDQEAQNLQNELESGKKILSVCVPPEQPAQP